MHHKPNMCCKISITCMLLILITSCIKEDISNLSNNIMINQSFSIPFGPANISIDAPLISDTSSFPGRYGSFYYDSNIYPTSSPYFITSYNTDFSLQDTRGREEWIKRIIFHLLVENSFPTNVYAQVYIYEQNTLQRFDSNMGLDSLFVNGPVLVDAADVNSQGEVVQPSSKIYDVPFEDVRLSMLKRAKFLVYMGKVSTSGKVNPIRLSDKNHLKINTALQVDLKYNIKDTNK